ncbi:GPI-anchored protein llg1 [Orobanche gracilis]
MGRNQIKCCLVLLVCFSLVASLPASTFISDGIFGSSVLSQRRLLQNKKPCPVNFEHQNYSIITNQCKGLKYPPKLCCGSFKEFACPYADELNDLTNDCATTMFSYINLFGGYPPGLFANECKEGQLGLECPAASPTPSSHAGRHRTKTCRLMILLVVSILLLQFI